MVKEEIGEAARDPEKFLLELLNLAGYTGALAKPLVASKEDFLKINLSLIEKFYVVRSLSDLSFFLFFFYYTTEAKSRLITFDGSILNIKG